MVFDHFMIVVVPRSEKITSPLASCLVGSNVETKCGSMLEMHRNEKYASE